MIHVCFCMTDKTGRYSKFIGTAMLSIFENINTPPLLSSVIVHILHDNTLTTDNRNKFISIARQYRQFVTFYNVEELYANKIEELKRFFPNAAEIRFTIAMFYRFFIPEVLPKEIKKAIYLDADVIVNLDINDLWRVELGDSPLAVVPKITQYVDDVVGAKTVGTHYPLCQDKLVKIEDYFNSGVLLMNLKILREEESIISGIDFISNNLKYCKYPDQDILNYSFSKRAVKLSKKFNRNVNHARAQKDNYDEQIFHYNINVLGTKMSDPLNRLWFKYFVKTPWFNEETIGHLHEGFLKIRSDLKNSALKLSAIMSGKRRAFFVEPAKVDSMKKIFSIRDDELIVPAENEDSLKKLIDVMKINAGKYVFFIMTEKFLKKKFPFDILTKEKFVENVDFVKGWNYLDSPFNSYPLIQAM